MLRDIEDISFRRYIREDEKSIKGDWERDNAVNDKSEIKRIRITSKIRAGLNVRTASANRSSLHVR